ncbi:hypothetical protein PC110_g14022 [Phytophthora cactorum]|uniref:Uncharacterized protein n=1 Tax=Phytophthora cactorum TaxID=29920 RepID=A0A329RYG3_9STRA|nr:hypothetical protein PC112_g22133 [Phytophthora cactorum]KAG2873207.1 hypothetical protein PC114_g25980 [Phytophthora cactorum]KAG2884539.1 hypothetical protein PC117_g25808 [Phytophthora cactorum]KAG3125004.1 hypothetical protein C6341_g25951 [Phytophthora cactorum]RAW29611.1 hypothetical protein PC110_g14022 [Phytophthora cactorum]
MLPTYNPIEGCFSVPIARILALHHGDMINVPYGKKTERRKQLLERAAEHAMPCMELHLVNTMA